MFTTVEVNARYQNGVAAFGHLWILNQIGPAPWEGALLTGHLNAGWGIDGYNCGTDCAQPDPQEEFNCTHQVDYWYWDYDFTCECQPGASPIVVDLEGDGFAFTNPASGVSFDLLGTGQPVQTAWTSGGRDGFLALDRNGNGLIDSSRELFGNITGQPAVPTGETRNGFLALKTFDAVEAGGNGDGEITSADSVFGGLRLWFDVNQDGVSQASELKTLASVGVTRIELNFKKSKKTDDFGNRLLFRSKVVLNNVPPNAGSNKRNAVDVYFKFVQ